MRVAPSAISAGYGVCYFVAAWAFLLTVSVLTLGACSSHNPRPPQPQRPWICTMPTKQVVAYKNHTPADMGTFIKPILRKSEVNKLIFLVNMLM